MFWVLKRIISLRQFFEYPQHMFWLRNKKIIFSYILLSGGLHFVYLIIFLEECVRRLLIWKEAMVKKGLRVNEGKTKVMICGTGLDLLQSSGEYPCAVCPTGVGNNSIYCNGCKLWVHKKCSGLQRLTPDPDYRCARCMGNAHPIDGRPKSEVQVGPDKLEVVASFCYLGDMLSAGGGCEMAVTTRLKTAWKKFREPVLTSRHLSYKTRGHVYSSWVLSTMLHASETWPLTKTNLQCLQGNDRAMIRQICSIKPEDVATVRSSKLLAKLHDQTDLQYQARGCGQFSHPATSLTRPVAMCTALACGAPCSMPVKLGHLPRRTCSACNAMIGP